MPRSMNREQRALVRLLQLSLWVQHRGAHGFTFADVREQFPDDYRVTVQADKQWTRDKTQLRRMGLRIRLTARGVYVVDSGASRARALRLTPAEVAVLDDVNAFAPSIDFADAAHHVRTGLRKLVLSGVGLRSGSEGRAAATRSAWDEANSRLPSLSGASGPLPVVDIVYADPVTGTEVKHRVELTRVYLEDKVVVGVSDQTGSTELFLGAFVKSFRPVPERRAIGSAEGLRQMSGYSSFVDGFADEVARKWNARSGAAPRPNVTSMQRALGTGYLLLNAMIGAYPDRLSWAEAMRLSGAESRSELDQIVKVLEQVTAPNLGEWITNLAIEPSADGIGLYMHHEGIPRLALRPVEVAMLVSMARAASADVGERRLALAQARRAPGRKGAEVRDSDGRHVRLRGHAVAEGLDALQGRVGVDLQDDRDAAVRFRLVAAGEVPGDRDSELREPLEDDGVAGTEFLGRQESAQRIVDVWVGSGLVEDEVATAHRLHHSRQTGEEAGRLAGRVVLGACGEVADPTPGTDLLDDVIGAVSLVHVAVEDADTANQPLLAEHAGRHHETVEGAEAVGACVAGVVEAGDGGHCSGAGLECVAGCREHRPARVRERGRDAGRAGAEAVQGAAGKDVLHVAPVVDEAELGRGDGGWFEDLHRQPDEFPGGNDLRGLVGARRTALARGGHLGGEEDGEQRGGSVRGHDLIVATTWTHPRQFGCRRAFHSLTSSSRFLSSVAASDGEPGLPPSDTGPQTARSAPSRPAKTSTRSFAASGGRSSGQAPPFRTSSAPARATLPAGPSSAAIFSRAFFMRW